MERQLEDIRDQQRAAWNKFSPGWRKWDDMTMVFLKPFGDEIIQRLNLKVSDVVLDIAAGTGEPGLSIASQLSSGKVIITDLSEEMLNIARENAVRKGITNIETRACDVCELPFADNTFDAISCRMGFMFFPDMLLAAREILRVLKPGGRFATSVWNVPEKNFWITSIMRTITHNMEVPVPPPGAPGMFRCAKESLISDLVSEAGFKNVDQTEIAGKLEITNIDAYWGMMTEVSATVAGALINADDEMKAKIKSEVYQSVGQLFPKGPISFDTSALVIWGEK